MKSVQKHFLRIIKRSIVKVLCTFMPSAVFVELKLKYHKTTTFGHFSTLLRHEKGSSYQSQIQYKLCLHVNEQNGDVLHQKYLKQLSSYINKDPSNIYIYIEQLQCIYLLYKLYVFYDVELAFFDLENEWKSDELNYVFVTSLSATNRVTRHIIIRSMSTSRRVGKKICDVTYNNSQR